MNKLKVLAACVALACAGEASATLTDVNTAGTGSSLYLIVWKGVNAADPNSRTYVLDLGKKLSDVVTNVSANSGPNASFTSFTKNLDATFTGQFTSSDTVSWSVVAGIGAGAFPQYAVTADAVGGAVANSQIAAAGTNKINGPIGIANGTVGACTPSCILPAANFGGDAVFWGSLIGNTLSSPWDTAGNGYGDTTQFYNLVKTGTTGASQQYAFAGTWKLTFTGGTPTIAYAVPEPSTYLLLTAGLAFMGFVARRRMRD